MKFDLGSRSDFVVGMSLAEIILLLLLALFLTTAATQSDEDADLHGEALKAENRRLQDEIESMRANLRGLEDKVRAQALKIEQLARMAGSQGTNIGDFESAFEVMRRGYRKCNEPNTVIAVRWLCGEVSFSVKLTDRPVTERWAVGGTGMANLDAFLQELMPVQRQQKCRYDYSLIYATSEDYHKARERLERYVYPGQIAQADSRCRTLN